MAFTSANIEYLACCILALGLSVYAWLGERSSVTSTFDRRTRLFRLSITLSAISATVCTLLFFAGRFLMFHEKGAQTVALSGLGCSASAVILGFCGRGPKGLPVVTSGALSAVVWLVSFAFLMMRYM